MCGIVGVVGHEGNFEVDQALVTSMRDTLVHRGPDGAGLFLDRECGLGHRRLSIIDLTDRASQPFQSSDGRLVIVFNGEIFNYKELRQTLKSEGFVFRSDSDTEVLLNLFIRYGPDCLDQLNGMFTFAIWDTRERTLFLARDRVGVKPLYYAEHNGAVYFASEPKALFAGGVPLEVNRDATDELLLFRYVAGEQTMFKKVKRLLPGHCAWVKNGRMTTSRWWNLSEKIKANREKHPKDVYSWFEDTFFSSVKYRTISDVPVGLMLSGGLDSGSVAAALNQNGEQNLQSFTYVFDDPQYDEGHLAAEVSERFGLQLNRVSQAPDQLVNDLKEAAWLYDEPLVHQNDTQMLALSKVAKQKVTVLLSGEGADELMGGYVRYKPLNQYAWLKAGGWAARWLSRLPTGGIVNRFDKLSRYLADDRLESLVLLNASNVYPTDLMVFGTQIDLEKFDYRQRILAEARDLFPAEPARQAMYMDLFIHMASVLDRNDRMTMGASIECRVPFMDYRFLEMIPALPSKHLLTGKKGKHLLFKTVGQRLPEKVRRFKKLGFSVPWDNYENPESPLYEHVCQVKSGSLRDIFPELNTQAVASNGSATLKNALMRQLAMVEIWRSTYLNSFR